MVAVPGTSPPADWIDGETNGNTVEDCFLSVAKLLKISETSKFILIIWNIIKKKFVTLWAKTLKNKIILIMLIPSNFNIQIKTALVSQGCCILKQYIHQERKFHFLNLI